MIDESYAQDLVLVKERREQSFIKTEAKKSMVQKNYTRNVRPRNFIIGDLVLCETIGNKINLYFRKFTDI